MNAIGASEAYPSIPEKFEIRTICKRCSGRGVAPGIAPVGKESRAAARAAVPS